MKAVARSASLSTLWLAGMGLGFLISEARAEEDSRHIARHEIVVSGDVFKNDFRDVTASYAREAEAAGEFRVFLQPPKRIELIRWIKKPTGRLSAKPTWWQTACPRERDLREALPRNGIYHGLAYTAPVVIERALQNGSYSIVVLFQKNESGMVEPRRAFEWVMDWDFWQDIERRRAFLEQAVLGKEACDLGPIGLRAEGPCVEGLKHGHWRFVLPFGDGKRDVAEEGNYVKGHREGRWFDPHGPVSYEHGKPTKRAASPAPGERSKP